MFRAHSSRGAVLIWRQSETEAGDTGAAAPRSRWLVYSSRGRGLVFATPRAASGGGATVSVPAGALTLTGFAPTVSTSGLVSVSAGALTLTGYAPDVSNTAGTTIFVPAGGLTLTGYAPTVVYGASAVIGVPKGELVITGLAPIVLYETALILGAKLDEFPLLPADSVSLNRKLTDLFRLTNSRVNAITEGRIFDHYNARTVAPASTEGGWGDFIKNARPKELGSTPNKYVVTGWIRLQTDWVECRVLTGN